jgi:20S proteasome alpha/beta subunit
VTIVLGFIGKDGALMASDGQVTTGSSAGPIRLRAPKIKQVGNLPILWGGAANDLGFIQKIEERIQVVVGTGRPSSLSELRPHLVKIVHGLRKEVLVAHRELYGSSGEERTPYADVLFVEYRENKGRILSVSRDGSDVWLDDFCYGAVGIGDSFAYTLLWGHNISGSSVNVLKVHACRVIEDAIDIGAFGMGPPIDLWVIKPNGEVQKLEKAEVEAIGDTCRGLREAILETFKERLELGKPDS